MTVSDLYQALDQLSEKEAERLYRYVIYPKEISVKRKEEILEQLITIFKTKTRLILRLLNKEDLKQIKNIQKYGYISFEENAPSIMILKRFGMIIKTSVKTDDKWHWILNEECKQTLLYAVNARHHYYKIRWFYEFDNICKGIVHTYGLLPYDTFLHMLQTHGIDLDEEEIRERIYWRLEARSLIKVMDVRFANHKEIIRYIKDPLYEFEDLYQRILEHVEISYKNFTSEELMMMQDDNYLWKKEEILAFFNLLRTKFSRRFSQRCVQEVIASLRLHKEYDASALNRIFSEETIHQAITLIQDILPRAELKGFTMREYKGMIDDKNQ